jgi:hypothetical protein
MTCASKLIEATWDRTIRSSSGGGGGMLGPRERTWLGVGTKLLASLYPGGTKILGLQDGLWEVLAIEVLRVLYLGGSDGFFLRRSGVPIGA